MTSNCEHLYPVIDEHEGTSVCCDCGLVIEKEMFLNNWTETDSKVTSVEELLEKNKKNDALEVLSRLNLPTNILDQLTNENQNVDNLYDAINKKTAVTSKEFCAATGMSAKKLVKLNQHKILNTNLSILLEKYCKLLNLSYRDYTLIKALIDKKPTSGHPPLTIIGYYILVYCRENKIKKYMKDICSTLSISTISIQRYRKYELSRGGEISTR
jgi:transcription initiation factor TFIIIB Brf1 subunit/transcription initiation factor TFIIB